MSLCPSTALTVSRPWPPSTVSVPSLKRKSAEIASSPPSPESRSEPAPPTRLSESAPPKSWSSPGTVAALPSPVSRSGAPKAADHIVAAKAYDEVEPVCAVHDVVGFGADARGVTDGRWTLDVQRVGGAGNKEYRHAYRGEQQGRPEPHPARRRNLIRTRPLSCLARRAFSASAIRASTALAYHLDVVYLVHHSSLLCSVASSCRSVKRRTEAPTSG